jgi:hypothetical protein
VILYYNAAAGGTKLSSFHSLGLERPAVMLDAIRGQIAPQADDPLVWGWIAGLLITQLVVQTLAAAAGPFKKHPGLFAHQVCSMAAILATAGSGVYYWFTVADSVSFLLRLAEPRRHRLTKGERS